MTHHDTSAACVSAGFVYDAGLPSSSGSSSEAGLLSAAIEAMTSAGARRCQLARVRFELAPTVTANMSSLGSSVLSKARNISVFHLADILLCLSSGEKTNLRQ